MSGSQGSIVFCGVPLFGVGKGSQRKTTILVGSLKNGAPTFESGFDCPRALKVVFDSFCGVPRCPQKQSNQNSDPGRTGISFGLPRNLPEAMQDTFRRASEAVLKRESLP